MGKQKLKDLVKQLNADNAPPDGWHPEDQVRAAAPAEDKPEAGKVYALTGGPGSVVYLVFLFMWPTFTLASTGVVILALAGIL